MVVSDQYSQDDGINLGTAMNVSLCCCYTTNRVCPELVSSPCDERPDFEPLRDTQFLVVPTWRHGSNQVKSAALGTSPVTLTFQELK
jgi:hypothetical protein